MIECPLCLEEMNQDSEVRTCESCDRTGCNICISNSSFLCAECEDDTNYVDDYDDMYDDDDTTEVEDDSN